MYTEIWKCTSQGVLSYGEPVKVHGLNLLSAPEMTLLHPLLLQHLVHISFYLQLEEELLLLLLFQLLRFLQILLLQIRNQTGSTLTVAFLSKMELQQNFPKTYLISSSISHLVRNQNPRKPDSMIWRSLNKALHYK